jgi:hypothetical protein
MKLAARTLLCLAVLGATLAHTQTNNIKQVQHVISNLNARKSAFLVLQKQLILERFTSAISCTLTTQPSGRIIIQPGVLP